MNLDIIIGHLRFNVPALAHSVGGAAKFDVLPAAANLRVPAAYVLPLDEQPQEQVSQNGYQQIVREGFAVVAVLDNRGDERGQAAAMDLDEFRKMLFAALLGFEPGPNHDAVAFEGGQLLHMDRARLYYQFEFYADYALDTSDTWIPRRNSDLRDFERVQLKIDALDVFDPNMPATDFPSDPLAYPGGKGPDGRFEGGLNITLPTS